MLIRSQTRTATIAAMILAAVMMYATVLWNRAKLGNLENDLSDAKAAMIKLDDRFDVVKEDLESDIDMWQMYVQALTQRMERAGIQVPDMPQRGDPP